MNEVGIQPYTIIERHQLGIIGVITPDTKGSLLVSPIVYYRLTFDSIGTSSGAGPGTEFTDPIAAVQTAVDELHAQNITRIIALTHIGYEKDIELAQNTRGVQLVRRKWVCSTIVNSNLLIDRWWSFTHSSRELYQQPR